MNIDPRKLLSVSQFAELVGVGPHTIRAWIRDGRIEVYRIGNRVIRIDPDQVDAIVTKQPRN
ncbi:helix-turn-helix domain-containing protein [Rhodococcoides yunnanense]|uniref:Helix-turn-helix domain-containing protein n=1 Tax=Rhodococcoides yunnanense TaxID=278209 RepID=A0ABU4BDQ5_9NOCA|nr:helix-turn-helix domain-containing protein [Rhodococcus yunnanensis]MDV6262340.1 helix-turn-helix domain-containing protein [Rhodococcus yunnanensis]